MIGELKTLLAVKAKQKKEYVNICQKSESDQQQAENKLKQELTIYFEDIITEVLKLYNSNDTIYEYQVEELINNKIHVYETILSENIHDYYITVSENSETQINNLYNQREINTITDHIIQDTPASKGILDDLLDINEYLDNLEIHDLVNIDNLRNMKRKIKLPPNSITNNITEIFEYEVDQAVIDYMSKEVFIASTSTMERVTQEIYDIIKEAYAEQGEGTKPTTESIIERFHELQTYEAERIARTETLKAQGHANYQRLQNNDTVEYKQWLSTNDSRTRDSHAEQDGQITYTDGVFENGLQYPGDTNGEIEEWINCRCDLVAYYPEPGMVAPAGLGYWFEDDMVIDLDMERYDDLIEVPDFIPSFW